MSSPSSATFPPTADQRKPADTTPWPIEDAVALNVLRCFVAANADAVILLRYDNTRDNDAVAVVAINDEFTRLTGLTLIDLHDNSTPLLEQLAGGELQHGLKHFTTPTRSECRVFCKDGRWVRLHSKRTNVSLSADAPEYVAIELSDTGIVENQQADEDKQTSYVLTWHAAVQEVKGGLDWSVHADADDKAHDWLPVEMHPNEPFFDAFHRSIVLEDLVVMDQRCAASLRENITDYEQVYRIKLPSGKIRWLHENVKIDRPTPGSWTLNGSIYDAADSEIPPDVPLVETGLSANDMQTVFTSARCLLWHANVTNRDGTLYWRLQITDHESAGKWLPIAVVPGEGFLDAFRNAIHPDDVPAADLVAKTAILAGETRYNQEYRVRMEDGEYRWLSEDVQIDQVSPALYRLAGVITDISEKKLAEAKLAEERHLLRTLIDNVPDYVYFKDRSNRLLIDNKSHVHLHEAAPDSNTDAALTFDMMPASRADDHMIMESAVAEIDREECVTLADGERVWFSVTRVPLHDSSGAVNGLVGIRRNISNQKRLEAEREQLLNEAIDRAERDPLTGLWNHGAFQKRLKNNAEQAMQQGTSLAIIVLDMDNFKFFNDSFGHPVGDEVLCTVGDALSRACRPEDTVSRFGGDEFAILMPLTDPSTATARARQIADRLRTLGYRPPKHASTIPIRLSFGVAVYPEEGKGRLDALALADDRLMRAKSGQGDYLEIAERLSSELSDSHVGYDVLRGLVGAVDKKDRYTRAHSERVLQYATMIGNEIGLTQDALRWIQIAALVFDVGKIGVPDHILRKPSKLTCEEYRTIKLHPTMGALIVSAVPDFEQVIPAVRHHHERWDGTGYPDRLAGDDIPLMARILAVADGYAAMTVDRPYRKAMTHAAAIRSLHDGADAQWDPKVINAFITAHQQHAPK